ncbi:hypothetical protein COV94_04520 [Candidatus Woesearchaeota archaeon CG11_big_fil_rev_8_21_14_0_20_57_5]|nr:MAG: hypothetical protein COV94_04520 [Candidatus Woesearchaeota archaeon CG11_big_fil_rev_8_21_14_0_20_57_5]
MRYRNHQGRRLLHLLSAPVIWAVIIPLIFLDLFAELYHHICFPVYGLKRVRRADYIRIDRQRLSYLRFFDKVNCMYCGYANGFLAYASEIAARTEAYWCGIKHQQGGGFHAPKHHDAFPGYGDERAFRRRYDR